MMWLLGEIGISLLLAALLGWFVGWTLRGFAARDRIEDLRRQLNTTAEIKERELVEAYRRSESMRARVDTLERQRRRLEDELEAAPADAAPAQAAPAEPTLALSSVLETETRDDVPLIDESSDGPELRPTIVRAPPAEVSATQAEMESLRAALERKATRIAELENRVLEIEPSVERLRQREERIRELRTTVDEMEARLESVQDEERRRDERVTELEALLRERDTRVNEFRAQANDVRADLERVKAESSQQAEQLARAEGLLARRERELREARITVQRQLERIRKQEEIHRSVIDNLSAQPMRERTNKK